MLRSPCPGRRRRRRIALVSALAVGLLGLSATPAAAATFTVTTTADTGAGSLRQAIVDANGNAGGDTIDFNIAGTAPFVITPASPLPVITDGVIVDATTQPGFNTVGAEPVVQLDGADAVTDGLQILDGTGTVLRGLSVTRFTSMGIIVDGATDTTVAGTWVGIAPDHSAARIGQRAIQIGHDASGGDVTAGTVIGGPSAADRNVIGSSENQTPTSRYGIVLSGPVSGTVDTLIENNYIGTDPTGMLERGFSHSGIIIQNGAGTEVRNNLISGNRNGITFGGNHGGNPDTTIVGNRIGPNAAGSGPALGNVLDGIVLLTTGLTTRIGGPDPSDENTIAYNGRAGVKVHGSGVSSIRQTAAVLGNRIHSNGGLGVDLLPDGFSSGVTDGVTANDADDADTGGNGLQNFPVISAATAGATQSVTWSLSSTPSDSFTVEFFTNTQCDTAGHGEGERLVGRVAVATDSSGAVPSTTTVIPGAVAVGEYISATATRTAAGEAGQTSEFSQCVQAQDSGGGGGTDGISALAIDVAPQNVNARGGRHAISGLNLASLPLRDTQLEASPLRGIDVAGAPLRGINIDSTPLRGIPLRGIPLRGIPLRGIPLRGIAEELPLSSLPLYLPGGWDALLAGTQLAEIPLQSLTLGDVLDEDPTLLDSVDLVDVGIAASPLRGISIGALSVGAAPLRGIELPGFDPAVDYTAQWQALLADLGFADAGFDGDSTLIQLDVEGVPLRGIPLRGIPLRGILLAETAVMDSPLRGIPLRGIPLAELPDAAEFVDCNLVDCATADLGQAADAGAVLDDATLGELLLRMMDPEDYPWEDVPLDALAKLLPLGNTLGVDVTFTPGVAAGTDTANVTVAVPDRFDYVPGSAELGGTPIADPTANADGDLVFSVPVTDAAPVALHFASAAGFRLGSAPFAVTAELNAASDSATSDPVEVRQRFEPANDTVATAQAVDLDDLVVSHIATEGDVDYYRIPAPPAGTRLGVYLSHQAVDGDLVLYSPATAPLRGIGFRGLPLRGIPIQDGDETGLGPVDHAKPEALNDSTLAPLPLRGISANRGEADENIEVASVGSGDYIVQVSGYNGTSGDMPYVLRAQALAEPPDVGCGPRTLPNPAGAAGARAVTGLPTDSETLVLVNQQRLTGTHGATASTQVMAALDRLVARPKGKGAQPLVRGGVVTVDAVPAVGTAYAQWDQDPCIVDTANAVVTAIGDVIDQARSQAPNLKHIVLVGGDDLLPQARVADLTKTANQRDYAGDIEAGNPLHAALAGSYVLSDNPYGDVDPIAWLDRALYVPDLAVGRLVESPTEIVGAVDRFIAAGGLLDPASAMVSGYDFLTDGADDVAAALDAHQRTGTAVKLVGEDWTATQLRDSLTAPDVSSVNAHFDHFRALSAFGNQHSSDGTRLISPDVMSVDDLATPTTSQRIWFSMGCHAGLSVADVYVGSKRQDWAQSLSSKTAGFVGNTGYGYGETERVALSELLMREFAERLDGSMSIGQALTFAKHEYFAQLGVYGEYDKKVLEEATFYGMPMYRIADGAPATAPPAPRTLTTDPMTQLQKATVTVDPTFATATASDGSTYLTADGDAQVTQNRPLQPRTSTDVTQPGATARGALITELSSVEETVASAAFARPIVDHSADEPAQPTADVVFPAAFSTISTYRDPSGQRQRLVLLPGQFISDPEGAAGSGTQRRFTHMETEVFYSNSSDNVAPLITSTQAVTNGTNTRFEVQASDNGEVKRVVALYREAGSGPEWQTAELTLVGGAWRANATTSTEAVEFLVQAVDGAGNVAISSNKGEMFPATASDEPEAPPLQATITTPADNAAFVLHETVAADYECSGGIGTPTCTGDVADGSPIDTASIGPKTFTVTATDGVAPAGAVHTYRVNYGFEWQLTDGATLPARGMQDIRWKVFDALAATYGLSAVDSVAHQEVSCSTGATIGSSQTVNLDGRKSPVTYDSTSGFTTFAVKAAKGWAGTCRVFRVTTTDGVLHTLRIQFT